MHRFIRRLAVLALLMPMGASPLGLGDITLHSALNQPLDAEIELTALGQTQGEEITVALASPAAFENAGIDRSLTLAGLTFEVMAEDGRTPYIRVSSTDPVKEPFLDFLVEIDWPSGHLLREYTLLLDPPVVVDEEPLPVESAVAGDGPVVSPAESALHDGSATSPESSARTTPVVDALSYGPVQRNDTLWSIASRMQEANTAATVEQIMMALLKANPEAFYQGNVNELKAGYVLRVSDPALLTAMSRAAALAEVRRQNEQWMDSKQARAGMAGGTPQGGPEAAPAGVAGSGDGDAGPRLRLSVPEATATGMALEGIPEGQEGGSPASEIARLKGELAAALETSEASRQENTELREHLATLQEQIDAMQRLTSLQDDTLAALQAGASAPAAAEAPKPVEEPASEAVKKDADKAAKAAGKPARKPEAPAKEGAGGLLDDPNLLAIGGAVGAALLVLIWLVMRRRRTAAMLDDLAATETESAAHDEFIPPTWATVTPPPAAAPVAPERTAAVAETAEAEDGGLDLMQADDDEIDVLAEADVYLAYRRFDKAEELLREAIKADPARNDLVLKLLEVQAASGNKNAFITQAESFKAMVGPGESNLWDKVVVMGRRIAPEHVLFGGAATAAVAAVADAAPAAGDTGLELSDELPVLELDADIAAELDRLAGNGAEGPVAGAFTASDLADEASSLPEIDLSLDEAVVSEMPQDGLGDLVGEADRAEPTHAGDFGGTSNVINFESRTGLGQGASGLPQDDAAGATGGGGVDRDLDWLTGSDEDFGPLDDVEGDDFSSLISGEDEVGTKLDLAKAYIDMGDQESARNILSEVVQEGTQDQQREANDLMRQIG
ncbi:MAG: hypothetical protein IT489_01875 [Gammaproteobacteria bacterium]|nr:hypothetical protein [Gammaproteobacteria bacterium]